MDLECEVCGHPWSDHGSKKGCAGVLQYSQFQGLDFACGCDEKGPSITEAMK
jgi:hypothetical protein